MGQMQGETERDDKQDDNYILQNKMNQNINGLLYEQRIY